MSEELNKEELSEADKALMEEEEGVEFSFDTIKTLDGEIIDLSEEDAEDLKVDNYKFGVTSKTYDNLQRLEQKIEKAGKHYQDRNYSFFETEFNSIRIISGLILSEIQKNKIQ